MRKYKWRLPSLSEQEAAKEKARSQPHRVVCTVEQCKEAAAEYWHEIDALMYELEQNIEGLENHYKGFNQHDTPEKIEEILSFLVARGVNDTDPRFQALITRAQGLQGIKPGRGRAAISPYVPDKRSAQAYRLLRAQVCGLLRALADVKPRGQKGNPIRNKCWDSIRAVAFPENEGVNIRREIDRVLAKNDAKKWRAYYKAIFENAFIPEEVAALVFPENDDEYKALFQNIIDHVQALGWLYPYELKKIFDDFLK